MELAKADSAEAGEEVRNDGPRDREDGHQALRRRGARRRVLGVRARERRGEAVGQAGRMRLKGGPQTMFGSDFANVELEPTDG